MLVITRADPRHAKHATVASFAWMRLIILLRVAAAKMIYSANGLPDEVAAWLQDKMIGAMCHSIEEPYVLASRRIKGERSARLPRPLQ